MRADVHPEQSRKSPMNILGKSIERLIESCNWNLTRIEVVIFFWISMPCFTMTIVAAFSEKRGEKGLQNRRVYWIRVFRCMVCSPRYKIIFFKFVPKCLFSPLDFFNFSMLNMTLNFSDSCFRLDQSCRLQLAHWSNLQAGNIRLDNHGISTIR